MAERYTVTLNFTAVDDSKPGAPPDAETQVVWRDLQYQPLVELEKLLLGVLQKTTEWGDNAVAEKFAINKAGPGK